MALLVYVDDSVLIGNDVVTCAQFKAYLNEFFHMKDLGALMCFLRIKVARNSTGVFLSQRKYAL